MRIAGREYKKEQKSKMEGRKREWLERDAPGPVARRLQKPWRQQESKVYRKKGVCRVLRQNVQEVKQINL